MTRHSLPTSKRMTLSDAIQMIHNAAVKDATLEPVSQLLIQRDAETEKRLSIEKTRDDYVPPVPDRRKRK